MKYDYLIVGAGLSGAVFSYLATRDGKKCLVIDRRSHVGGNCYVENIEGIKVHKYGAHIFRTNDDDIYKFVCGLCSINNFINSPVANYKGQLFNLPFNMNTFHQLWGVNTPEEAKEKIESQRIINDNPNNLEEHALNLVGKDIYNILIKEYTEKQWGRSCKELPASIMRRIPLRFTFDNNYFNAKYQGILDYQRLFENLLKGADVELGVDYNKNIDKYKNVAQNVIYTGPIDEYFNYKYGELEYRGLKFKNEVVNCKNFQGVAVMNFNDKDTPYTRRIEHKHFEFDTTSPKTVITYEYPIQWAKGDEPYYPINDDKNEEKYNKYLEESKKTPNFYLLGRLAEYKYYDMQDTIKSSIDLYNKIKGHK